MGRRWWVVATSMVGALVLLGACSSDDSSSAPDPSEKVVLEAYGIVPATPADLEQAATIVQERLGALDVRDASVKVKGQTLVATGTGVGEASAKVVQPGLLEFRPVLAYRAPHEAIPGDDENSDGPPGSTVLPGRPGSTDSGAILRYQVGPSALSGAEVSSATAHDLGGDQGWAITLKLSADGTAAFDALARESFPKSPPQNSVAIVLDGIVQTAPAFQAETFDGGEVQISGSFTEAEAKQLATILRFGSVPVPLRIAG